MKVLILTGGNSSEKTVSLNSARNVKKALIGNGHKVKLYDLINGYEGIRETALQFDILFPVLHGEEGEGGKLHEFLSKLNKPIVGTRNYKGLEKAWYKIPFKEFCDKNNIPTAPWALIKNEEEIKKFGFPSVLKASNGGSSREVVILKSEKDLKNKDFKKLISSNLPLFVEKYFSGTEITVGILNGKVLPFIEIVPPKDSWFSYENKYANTTQEIPFAPSVNKSLQKKIKDITIKIHKDFNLGTYFRTDFMIYNDIPYALDVNTIPGLTIESLMPKQAKAAGINFGEFLEILLINAK